MRQETETRERDAVLVEDAALIRMMGMPVLEAVPSRGRRTNRPTPSSWCTRAVPPLGDGGQGHEASAPRVRQPLVRARRARRAPVTRTGPGGSVERARLSEGSLLALRTGRGAWHAEAVGADEVEEGHGDTEFRSVLFWVNLARKDKDVEPSAQVVQPEDPGAARGRRDRSRPGRRGLSRAAGHACADPRRRAPRRWGGHHTGATRIPGLRLHARGRGDLRGDAPGQPAQLVLLGPGEEFTVTDAAPGTRFMLMAGQPYGEAPCSTGHTWTRSPLPTELLDPLAESRKVLGVMLGAGFADPAVRLGRAPWAANASHEASDSERRSLALAHQGTRRHASICRTTRSSRRCRSPPAGRSRSGSARG